ncbi:Peptidase C19, ubiquitin carboxyl-terminal hydrolase 2 [Cynara cardunculus var. scolymus]|uniref:ubiquitinyl hydrolase 1 n=1 Tax=Cynara cardunculus var. scolymus TaxID=59895 RepID=A0A103XC87_CYNCS|nr:Peptidase C19, ubiquitin carboxyl-terminal hydrolase 2 [Cynara cardunculus var. scolymus]
MLVRGDLGFSSLVFLVVVVVVLPVIVFIVRRKWRHLVARREEVKWLLASASEESARVEFEFEARETYFYTANGTPSARASVSPSASAPLGSPLKPQYKCAVCFCPTTTRCAKCKAVRYCSGNCQIIHWRQGHKYECRPYVSVTPISDVGGSSYRQGDCKDRSDDFGTEVKQTAIPAERFPENSHHKDDVGVESLAHRQGTNSTSESNPPLSYEGHSLFSPPTKVSAGVTFENSETVKPAFRTLVSSARKSTVLGKNNKKISTLSDEDAQLGTSSSSFWTDDGSNQSSLSEPSTNSSVGTIHKRKSNIDEHDDCAPGSSCEAANRYMASHRTKGGYNSNIMNGFSASKVIDGSGLTGLGSRKSNDDSNSSKDKVNDGSKSRRSMTWDAGVGSDLPPSKFSESSHPPSGASSHRASAGYSTLKDDKTVGGLPSSGPERSNDLFSNKNVTSHTSKSRELGSSSSRASDTYLTFTSRHASYSIKPVKVNNDKHRVTTCSSQLTENYPSVRSASNTSKLKVVDQVKPSKLSSQGSLEGGSETTHRYSFKGLFPYEMFVKLYNWKKFELQPFGLKNCGNSCYANAVLQCLIYTPPLTAYLLEGIHSKACDKRGWCLTCEFEGLVMKAKNRNSPLSPIRILTHIENIGSNLGHGREEDAHEFLRYVIDALQSVCIKEAGKNALNSLEEETTIIGLTFGGYLRSKISCMKCGGKSERHERMMDLTVEIEGNIRTLEEALDKFTCTEILDGENKYKCSRCKSYEKAKKKLTLLEAPNVLTIALKRFESGKFGKLNKSIRFPDILDMAPYVSGTSDKSPIYRLYGLVVHIDMMNAAVSGHYVCYVKNVQNRWFKFDDSMVKEVDLQHVLTKGAYMLLYVRCSPRAPRSIRNSLIHDHHDPRKHRTPPSSAARSLSTEPWDIHTYHPTSEPPVHHRSLEEESSSSDNSGFFSESCSCSTETSGIEDHISGDDYSRNMNLNSSDSDTSSTSSFPSPLYSRLSQLYASRTNVENIIVASAFNQSLSLD